MSKLTSPSPLRAEDYEALEQALMETARGRWFLLEYARRNQCDDTRKLLDAINKLKAAVLRPGNERSNEYLRRDLIEMAEAISRTRREIAAMRLPDHDESQLMNATEEIGAIVKATEKATSDILASAEDIQETAWQLREKEVNVEACDRIGQRVTDIYTACSFQDLTGQRTAKVVETLQFLEKRVNAMIRIWGLDDVKVHDSLLEESPRPDARLLNGPQTGDGGIDQSEIDRMLGTQHGEGAGLRTAAKASAATGEPASAIDERQADGTPKAEKSETSGNGSPLEPGRTKM